MEDIIVTYKQSDVCTATTFRLIFLFRKLINNGMHIKMTSIIKMNKKCCRGLTQPSVCTVEVKKKRNEMSVVFDFSL